MTYKWIFDTIQLFCLWIWKENSKYFWKKWKVKRNSINVGWTIDSLLCNLKKLAWITSSTSFEIIMYYYYF